MILNTFFTQGKTSGFKKSDLWQFMYEYNLMSSVSHLTVSWYRTGNYWPVVAAHTKTK